MGVEPGGERQALTPREVLILRSAADGMSSTDTATQLGMTVRDVEVILREAPSAWSSAHGSAAGPAPA